MRQVTNEIRKFVDELMNRFLKIENELDRQSTLLTRVQDLEQKVAHLQFLHSRSQPIKSPADGEGDPNPGTIAWRYDQNSE